MADQGRSGSPSKKLCGQLLLVTALCLVATGIIVDSVQKYSPTYDKWFSITYKDNPLTPGENAREPNFAQNVIPTQLHLTRFSNIMQKKDKPLELCYLLTHYQGKDGEDDKDLCTNQLEKDKKDDDAKKMWSEDTYDFITDVVFDTSGKDTELSEKISNRIDTGVSPFHAAMILSGCYGDFTRHEHSYSAMTTLKTQWFRDTVRNADTAFVSNIFLQLLEDTSSLQAEANHDAFYTTSRDRSMCNCMKDFAAPLYTKVNNEAPQYDSCLAQNLFDYTFDASDKLENGNDINLVTLNAAAYDASAVDSVAFVERLDGRKPMERTREDPIVHKIEAYVATVADTSALMKVASDDGVANMKQLVQAMVTSTLYRHRHSWDGDTTTWHTWAGTTLSSYLQGWETNMAGISFGGDLFDEAHHANITAVLDSGLIDWDTTTTTLANFKSFLITYAKEGMYAHNKIMSPGHDMANAKTDDTTVIPPQLRIEAYKMYLNKYLAMFQMCTQEAMPTYMMVNTEVTDSRHWIQFGECLLLFAALLGIAMHVNEKLKELDETEKTVLDSGLTTRSKTVTAVRFLCTGLMLFVLGVYCAKFIRHWREWDTNYKKYNSENSVRLTDYEDLQGNFSARGFMHGINITMLFVSVIGFLTFLAQQADVWWYSQNDEHIKGFGPISLKGIFNDENSMVLHVFLHIIFDVNVIIGLTNLAMAHALQKGVTFNAVLLSVILLFLTVGLLQHLSNIVYLVQHKVDCELRAKQQADPHVTYFAYNRAVCVFVVALGMLFYMSVANFSFHTWDSVILFNNADAWIFVASAFTILCGFDVGYEVFFHLYYKKRDDAYCTESFVKRKLFVTALIILVSIFVLKMHEYAGLCMNVYGRDPEYELTKYADTTSEVDQKMLKTRMHEMCNIGKFWFDVTMDSWKSEDRHGLERSRLEANLGR